MTRRSTTTSRRSRRGRYLGHERLRRARAQARRDRSSVKLVNLGKVFPGVGRPAAVEARAAAAGVSPGRARSAGRDHLGMPINMQPKFFRVAGRSRDATGSWPRSSRTRRAALALDRRDRARALWPRNATSPTPTTLAALARGMRARRRRARRTRGRAGDRRALRRRSTQEAIDRGVFGAPWYVYRRRTVLGTGPVRLFGPRTGKIACFWPAAAAGSSKPRVRRTAPARSATAARRARAPHRRRGVPLHATSFGRTTAMSIGTHLRARLRGGGDRLRRRSGSTGSSPSPPATRACRRSRPRSRRARRRT